MKDKTARRWLARNKVTIAKMINGIGPGPKSSFARHVKTCEKQLEKK